MQKILGADHVNVQPHSGTQANMAVFFSVLEPGDTILGMNCPMEDICLTAVRQTFQDGSTK